MDFLKVISLTLCLIFVAQVNGTRNCPKRKAAPISPLAEAACSKSGQRSSGQKVGLVAKGSKKNMQMKKNRIYRRHEFSGP